MARAVTESAHEANERFLFYNLRVGRENLQRILSMSGVEEVVA